ncbi:Lipoxygenase 6 protein [Thalictrum thalictroides]|uniref:Lipoxygenase 6 protein n=1 Tax=Thalictrum thalictroides TaxID=46969 RepID=A0A7J6VXU6_THATH|nr:Lipoxygenase 6 protein [Thalictrum thalictroides]
MFVAQPTTTLLKPEHITSCVSSSTTITRSLKDTFLGSSKTTNITRRRDNKQEFNSKVRGVGSIRAVISSGDQIVETKTSPIDKNNGALTSKGTDVKVVLTIRKKMKEKLYEKIDYMWESFINGIGQGILIQLVSEDIDPETNSGKTIESSVRGWLPRESDNTYLVEYAANFTVPSDFGCPGAVLVTNLQSKEFFLMEIVVHGFNEGPMFFPANSWIHSQNDNPESRIIFKNQAYLPSQTPAGLKDLRREDLLSMRGNGKGERKEFERIYDYATYNDLGNPDKDDDFARPVLGGEERPYPRRCRTGRAPTKTDPSTESRIEKPDPVYVPRDETFEEIKQATFSAGRLRGVLHNLIPSLAAAFSSEEIPFGCFSDIDKLYSDGVLIKQGDNNELFEKLLVTSLLKKAMSAGKGLFKYDILSIIQRDRFSWLRDNEFARQTLAGVNPVNIEVLKEFPILSKLDPADYGPPESLITKELINLELEGMDVDEFTLTFWSMILLAIENKRLFIIDYHDILLPFIKKMNSLPGRKAYASRTVFFYNKGVLQPIAIELSLPPSPSSTISKRVYTHGHDATKYWIWKLAKAHVCSNDAGVHQLVNHWGMAVEDSSMPCGVRLVIEDYPYAADGLLVWSAIKEWVESYVAHFYTEPNSVSSDVELQAWWSEIKNKGHYDKQNEPWWPKLQTKEDLSGIVTTMVWVASGQHAAINFGQYPFGGYVPNRPTLMRKLIPQEHEPAYEDFLMNPQNAFLSSLPTQLQATKVMAVQDSLSTHSADEEYLGQLHQFHHRWINDNEILRLFSEFSSKLEEIDEIINARNKDHSLKNRTGAGVPPYELLLPTSEPGVILMAFSAVAEDTGLRMGWQAVITLRLRNSNFLDKAFVSNEECPITIAQELNLSSVGSASREQQHAQDQPFQMYHDRLSRGTGQADTLFVRTMMVTLTYVLTL